MISYISSHRGAAHFPLLAGDNRENSGFGEAASGARREAGRIDFIPSGVFRRLSLLGMTIPSKRVMV